MTKISEIDKWNIIFSLIFLAFAFIAAIFIPVNKITTIDWFQFLIITLATFRLIRLFVYDKVMRWFKDYFNSKDNYFKMTIYGLLDCPWCFGVWATLLIAILYFIIPYGEFIVLIFAISGLASVIQIYINGVGWNAEKTKIEVKEIEKKK